MSEPNDHIDSSTSGYLTSGYEGLDTRFGDFSTIAGQGYCDLYRAKRYGRWFLLKCLKAEHQDDAAHQQMLRKELEVLMRLQHPGVMQVVGMEEVKLPDRGKTMCVVAEWIDGMTLAEYLAQNPTKQQLRRVALELADTLRYVHQQQVVHRDLKPSNVMITHNGSYVKLIDFGLADTDSHALLKQPAGTMRYMAPEQARLAQADVRNDIYSLGVIMQEMNRVQGGAVPRRIVDRCLAPIDQRWQDMDQLCDALRQSQRRRRNMMVAAAALTVAAVVAGLVWQIGKLRRQADDMDSRAALMSHQLRVLNREIIDFDDEQVRRKCIDHWDADGDGELSYDEAAAVTSLGQVSTADTTITAFNELEHFTGLEEIGHDAIQSHAIDSIYIPAATTSLTSTSLLSCGHLRRVVVSPQNPVYDSRDNCNGIVVTATNQLLTGFPGTRIPRSVTSLSDEAFNSLDLEELTIPAQITRIGPWSLVSRIGRIYLESPVPPAYDSEGGQLSIVAYGIGLYPNPDVYVPIGSLEAYAKADGWNRLAHLMREYPAAPCRVPLWPHVSASLTTFVPMHSNGSIFPALMP